MKKVLSVVLALLMMFALGVSASAFLPWDILDEAVKDNLRGSSPISSGVAIQAYSEYYGLEEYEIKGMLTFVENSEYMFVEVWTAEPEPQFVDCVTYDEDGNVCSATGWSIKLTTALPEIPELDTTADTITAGVKSAFDIAKLALDFILKNPLLSLIIGIGFAYTALTLIARGMRVAKNS